MLIEQDVTKEYIDNATPQKGRVLKVETLIKSRIESNCRFKVDVIIITNTKILKIIRYK